jgi:hypothetical protein
MMSGRCACGTVVYRLASEPQDTGWCHCHVCQHVSGSIGMVFTTVPLEDLQIVQGEDQVGRFASTTFGERSFCRACGSPLTIHVRHQPNEIDVAVGTLDSPDSVKPGFHLYVSAVPKWADLKDGLPQYEALRPETRGLRIGQVEA